MPIDPITGLEIPYAPTDPNDEQFKSGSLYDNNQITQKGLWNTQVATDWRNPETGITHKASEGNFLNILFGKDANGIERVQSVSRDKQFANFREGSFNPETGNVDALRQKAAGQVTSDDGKAGGIEAQSFSERSALPTTGTGTSAASYWDAKRGVQVHAPYGKSFQLFAGGGVKTVDGPQVGSGAPASSLFTQGTNAQGATPGFKEESLSYAPIEGKTIAETGQTVFNPTTKVDEYAGEGEVLIKYTDGTVERRKHGAQPGESTDINKFGRTPEELGMNKGENVAQILARGGTAQEADEAIKKAGLTPTSELQFVGTTYRGKAANEGNAWYVDPKTKEILQRPVALSKLAKPLTIAGVAGTKIDVVDKFQSVFGREPSADELKYWVGRTDKAGSALVGAMQFAKQNGTVKSSSQDPVQAIKENANTSQQKLVANYKEAGITVKSSEKSVMKAERESLQAPKTESLQSFTTSQLTSSQFQEASNDLNTAKAALRKLDSDYIASLKGEELRGVSMTQVRRRQGAIDISYSRTRSELLNEVQAYSDIVQSKTAMLGMMTEAFKFDSQTAQQDYTNRFNAATAMYNMTRQEEQDEFNMQQKLQDNQRANLAVVTSLLQSGNMKWDTMDADQKSQISMMEQAVGLPSGFSKFVGQTIKDPIVSFGTAYTDAGGVRRQPVYTTNPTTGNFTTKEIVMAGKEKVTGSGGSGRKPTEGEIARSATADMASQLNSRRGEDGYISPEDFRRSRQAWVGAGYDAKVFNNNFQYYANPGHVGDYGIPGE